MAVRVKRPADKPLGQTLNTKSAGEILRQERLRQGLSVDEVSQAIKVRPSMLEAIENGQFWGLTDGLYLKGFIRSYTDYLGLAEGDVMPFFRREYAEQEQQRAPKPLTPIDTKPKRISPAWVMVGVVVLAIFGVLGYAYYQYVSYALVPALSVTAPQDGVTVNQSVMEVTGRTDPDATLAINGQSVQLDPTGGFRVAVGLSGGSNVLTIVASNKLGKSTTIQRTVIVPQTMASRPTATPTVMGASTSAQASGSGQPVASQASGSAVPGSQTVRVVIGPASAWVQAKVDGGVAFEGVLLPGAVKTFEGGQVTIQSENAGSTRVWLNGVDRGVLGEDGATVERTYP